MAEHPTTHPETRRTVRDRLVAVQAAPGLTLHDLAAALHVSTPQLYQWLTSHEDARLLQQPAAQRLDAVERVARAWQARSAAPLRAVAHQRIANGSTGLELLAADTVTDHDLTTALDELKAMLQAQPKTRSQHLRLDARVRKDPNACRRTAGDFTPAGMSGVLESRSQPDPARQQRLHHALLEVTGLVAAGLKICDFRVHV